MQAAGALNEPDRRDRVVVGAGLTLICLLSWIYLFRMARDMYAHPENCMMNMVSNAWTPEYFGMTLLMWAVMMVAMMVPSVTPMILTFATINRKRLASGRPHVATGIFLFGYLAIWTAFSLVATFLQWTLHAAALMAPATLTVGPAIGGGLLIIAGAYQWTPWKDRCLAKCVSPLDFLLTEWRDGAGGAAIMGLRHGLFCTGCCAMLMVLLFVAGVMNLLWVATLGGLVLVEKLLPSGQRTSHAFGALFVLAGIALSVIRI